MKLAHCDMDWKILCSQTQNVGCVMSSIYFGLQLLQDSYEEHGKWPHQLNQNGQRENSPQLKWSQLVLHDKQFQCLSEFTSLRL